MHTWDHSAEAPRDFRLDRIKSVTATGKIFEPRDGMKPDLDGSAKTGVVSGGTIAKIWIEPGAARRVREEHEPVMELKDGAIVIELPYGGVNWLITEIFKFAGDAVVLEPADARDAVRAAAKALKPDLIAGVAAAKPRPRQPGSRKRAARHHQLTRWAPQHDQIKLTNDEIAAFLGEAKTVIVGSTARAACRA